MEDKDVYCSSKEIAKLFGVSVRWVQQLTQNEIISTTKVGRMNRYDKDQTVTTYIRYLQGIAYGKEKTDVAQDLKEQKIKAEIGLKESQSELHLIKTKIASGKYIDIEDVKLDYAVFFSSFKRFALNLPHKIAIKICGFSDANKAAQVEKELKNEIRKQLKGFIVAGIENDEKI